MFELMPAHLAALAAFLLATSAWPHYQILLPDRPSVKTGEAVRFTYRFGHPFEHQQYDARLPKELYVVALDGTKTDLSSRLEKVCGYGDVGKKVTTYQFAFTPEKRGDYTLVAVSPKVNVEGEHFPLKDVSRVLLHVQTVNGWDQKVLGPKSGAVELVPLTRPYGLIAPTTIQVEADEPAPGERTPFQAVRLEVEKFNPAPPKELPPDEYITRTARTTRAGDAVVILTEAGRWGVTAVRDRDKMRHHCTLWVYVDGTVPAGVDK